MENEKIVDLLFKLEMDDLKDADMLVDYAKKIMDYGDTSIAQAITNRAKARLAQLADCENTIANVMQRIKEEKQAAGLTYIDGGVYEEMYKAYITEWTYKIKSKIESM